MSNNRLDQPIQRINKLLEEDLSHDEEFGTQNGFHEVNDIKNEITTHLLSILRDLEEVIDELPLGIVERELEKLERHIMRLDKIKAQIDQTSKLQTNDQNFVNQRNAAHHDIKNFSREFPNELLDLQLVILTGQSTRALSGLGLADQSVESSRLLTSIRASEKDAEKIVNTLRDAAAKETYQESQSSYGGLSEAHARREWSWFAASVVALVGLFFAVAYIIFGSYSASDIPGAILIVFRKALLIGTPLLFLRISLTKYNAERHLRILYDHRNAALDQLRLLEAAIGDDLSAKAELRLEAAKMILSDPHTSYGSSAEGSDINISPVFSALEKAANKQSGS